MAARSLSDPLDVNLLPDVSGTDTESVRIETTPSGPTASIRTPDGRWVRLHSGRDPVAEADRDVAHLLEGSASPVIICIGVGLGYVLDAIERRAPATRVLAIEPCAAVARAMAERRSWHDWVASRRLTLLVGPDYAGAADAWRCLDGDVPAPVLVSPVLEREFPAECARAQAIARDASFGARANAEARRRFAPRYLLNTLRNIPVIAGSADVTALFDALPGVPAVVVGAGPSLDTNLDTLRELADRALIIAVDTAARPLLSAGIAPQLVVALDPSETNARHLRFLPDPSETWLVAEGSLHPSAFEQFVGRTFTFAVADHHPWPWLRSAGIQRGRLRAWGSVLTSAFDLALRIGCDPIVFTGADLSFTGGRPYCRGTTFEHEWARRVATGESLEDVWRSTLAAKEQLQRDDVTGAAVPTAPQLLAFRDWLVEQTRQTTTRRFVNASGAGVLAGGRIEQSSLHDVLAGGGGVGTRARATFRDAWRREEGERSGSDPLAQLRTLVNLGDSPGDPVDAWLAFGGSGLTRVAVIDALRDAANGRRPHSTRVPAVIPASAFRRDAPERIAALRAGLAGLATIGVPATLAEAAPASLAVSVEKAGRALARVLRASDLIAPEALQAALVFPPGTPASRALPWSPHATGLVLEFEAALADAVAGRVVEDDEASVEIERFGATLVPNAPQDGVAVSTPTPQDVADLTGQLALLVDWLLVLVRLGGDRAWIPPFRAGTAVLRSLVDALRTTALASGRIEGDQLELTVAGRRCVLAGDRLPSSASLTAMLTGGIVRVPPGVGRVPIPTARNSSLRLVLPDGASGETVVSMTFPTGDREARSPVADGPLWLQASRTMSPSGWVEPVRLNEAHEPCMIGGMLDESHALFTRVNGTHSLRIDASGRCVDDARWPTTIAGQIPWGADGSIAWRNGETSQVLWRTCPEGEVRIEDIPCARVVAHPQPDGSIWWTSSVGGLWSWTPGGTWRLLVTTPPMLGLQVDAGRVRLEPRGDRLDFAVRDTLTHSYSWTPGTSSIETIPLGPEGPCWSVSDSKDWTALAYPYSDVVLLRHRDGSHRTLACPYPFNVGWAGPSLVVSTGRGELLIFRDLAAWLRRDLRSASQVAV